MGRRAMLVAAVGLSIPLALLAFRLLPRPEVRLELVAPGSAVVDRDGDVRVDLVLHEAGTADLRAVRFSRAELTWMGGRVALEPLRDVSSLAAGTVAPFPLMSTSPVALEGSTEQAVLALDVVTIGEDSLTGDGAVGGASWKVPVQLRR